MTMSNRTFGVEIEFLGNLDKVLNAMAAAGLECNYEGYTHQTRPGWKLVTDGSIEGGEGYELVSPILQGEAGVENLRKAVKALIAAEASVNKSCGLHVHVGARDLSTEEIYTIVRRYGYNESKLDAIMPVSRRANNNTFCRSVAGYGTSNFGLMNIPSTEYLCNTTFRYERYFKVNVQSYMRHGTVEFRQHSASVNASKISNWAIFCVNFVDTTVAGVRAALRANVPVSAEAPTRRRGRPTNAARAAALATGTNPYRAGSKKNKLWQVLSERWCTVDYLARSLSTSEASVAAMLSQFRQAHTLTRRGSRGNYVYGMTSAINSNTQVLPVAAPVVSNVNILSSTIRLDPFHGLSNEIVGFYTERAMELGA